MRNPPEDYPDKCIALPIGATDDEVTSLCQGYTARLLAFVDDASGEQAQTRTRYDGSVGAACLIYQEHPRSRFHRVKGNTRKTYLSSLRVLISTIGRRQIRKMTPLDVDWYYEEWRKPAEIGQTDAGEPIFGKERIDRAHDAVSMLRTVLHFMAALKHKDCKELVDELKSLKFEKGGAREEELTYQHATAFIAAADDLAARGVQPADRALYMAIGTAGQFEMGLRQRDVIGEWFKTQAEAEREASRAKIEPLRFGDEWWVGYFTWERIPGWRWRMRTSKSKYRSAGDFDLQRYPLLIPLLERVPHEQRQGAIVKGEGGLPVRRSSYGKWFRQIAQPAGIPDTVWNMDARAGAITEAEEAGARREDVAGAATHDDPRTTQRYIRRREKVIARVADARQELRRASDGDGTA